MSDLLKSIIDYVFTPAVLGGVFIFSIKKYWNLYTELHAEKQRNQHQFNEEIKDKLDELVNEFKHEVKEIKKDVEIIKNHIGIK